MPKDDLDLELWTARENVNHIGQLYKERVLSKNERVERQSIVSGPSLCARARLSLNGAAAQLQQELKQEKGLAVVQRAR